MPVPFDLKRSYWAAFYTFGKLQQKQYSSVYTQWEDAIYEMPTHLYAPARCLFIFFIWFDGMTAYKQIMPRLTTALTDMQQVQLKSAQRDAKPARWL